MLGTWQPAVVIGTVRAGHVLARYRRLDGGWPNGPSRSPPSWRPARSSVGRDRAEDERGRHVTDVLWTTATNRG